MKKYVVAIILFFVSQPICSQQITFQKIYPGPQGNIINLPYEVIQTPDSGYLTGNRQELLKIDSLGNKQWMQQFPNGMPYVRGPYSIVQTSKNEYVGVGTPFIFKLDSNFNFKWKKDLNGISSVILYCIRETTDEGLIIGGHIDYQSINDSRFLLIKADSSGTVQWSKVYDMPLGDGFGFLALSPDGGYMLSGSSGSPINAGLLDISVLKVNSAGNSQWGKHYTSPSSESACYHIIRTSDNNYVLTGYRNLHRFILKIDSVGNKLWEKFYESQIYGDARWIEETNDKGLILTGNLEGNDSGFVAQTCLLMKTDSMGNVEWARGLGGYGAVFSGSVKQTNDGGYILGARSPGLTMNSEAIFLIKTDSLGHTNGCLEGDPVVTVSNLNDTVFSVPVVDSSITVVSVPVTLNSPLIGSEITLCAPVGIEETQIEKAEIEIYPNPFTSEFTVRSSEKINQIIIYDVMGEKVYEKEFSSNQTKEEINLSFLQQGVYFLNVKANGESWTRKVVKM